MGGAGSDKAYGGDDSSVDTLLGDNGKIVFTGAVITLIQSTAFADGGNDTLQGGAGDDSRSAAREPIPFSVTKAPTSCWATTAKSHATTALPAPRSAR